MVTRVTTVPLMCLLCSLVLRVVQSGCVQATLSCSIISTFLPFVRINFSIQIYIYSLSLTSRRKKRLYIEGTEIFDGHNKNLNILVYTVNDNSIYELKIWRKHIIKAELIETKFDTNMWVR